MRRDNPNRSGYHFVPYKEPSKWKVLVSLILMMIVLVGMLVFLLNAGCSNPPSLRVVGSAPDGWILVYDRDADRYCWIEAWKLPKIQ